MKLTINLHNREMEISFTEETMDYLIGKNVPLVKVKDIMEKNRDDIEQLPMEKECMIIDSLTFSIKKADEILTVLRMYS